MDSNVTPVFCGGGRKMDTLLCDHRPLLSSLYNGDQTKDDTHGSTGGPRGLRVQDRGVLAVADTPRWPGPVRDGTVATGAEFAVLCWQCGAACSACMASSGRRNAPVSARPASGEPSVLVSPAPKAPPSEWGTGASCCQLPGAPCVHLLWTPGITISP